MCFLRWSVASGAPQERGSDVIYEESLPPERGSCFLFKGIGAWPRSLGARILRFYEESLPLERGSYVLLRGSVASGAPQERGSYDFYKESWPPERGSYVFYEGSWLRER